MDVEPALVADGEAPKFLEPSEAALDDPSMSTEFPTGFDTTPGNPRLDLPAMAGPSTATMIIRLVRVQLVRPASRATAFACNGRYRVEQCFEGHAVVDVGSCQKESERNAPAIGDQVTLGSRFASIGRVRAGRLAPFLAAMDELSMQARLQSIRSASRRCRSNSRCRRSHTPAVCQSRSRRQQVTPEPQPISIGSISHGMPVRRTNNMPVRAARAGMRGRPPLGFSKAFGKIGSMISQSDSGRSGVGIPSHESLRLKVQGF